MLKHSNNLSREKVVKLQMGVGDGGLTIYSNYPIYYIYLTYYSQKY